MRRKFNSDRNLEELKAAFKAMRKEQMEEQNK